MSKQNALGRREIILAIAAICATLTLLDYFVKTPIVYDLSKTVQNWAVVGAGFAMGIGLVNLALNNSRHITRRTPGRWQYSAWLLICMVVTLAIGILGSQEHPMFKWIFGNIYSPITSAVYASLAFWICSAAYRAFRVKNLEVTVFIISAFVMMYRNVPLGGMISPLIPALGDWILYNPTSATNRGIMITAAVGAIAVGLRTLLGEERVYG